MEAAREWAWQKLQGVLRAFQGGLPDREPDIGFLCQCGDPAKIGAHSQLGCTSRDEEA